LWEPSSEKIRNQELNFLSFIFLPLKPVTYFCENFPFAGNQKQKRLSFLIEKLFNLERRLQGYPSRDN
jgi:hypothetical protein